jgi:predicted metalloprotease with PDZ domain
MKIINYAAGTFFLLLFVPGVFSQENTFDYTVDLYSAKDDAFHVTIKTPELGPEDDLYSFVSFAPGVHQPLDFGRFVKSFAVYDEKGSEIVTRKLNTNDWMITAPERVARIDYIIDDSRDMQGDDIIYPMSGTAITEDFAVLNNFGIFGYFHQRKDDPIRLTVVHDPEWTLGTALSRNEDGSFSADSYYHLADSPILAGRLSAASRKIGDMNVEAYVYSPIEDIAAEGIMDMSEAILASAYNFIGFSPVDRYTFLMYFHDPAESHTNPVLRASGALEHSYSSTYALPAMPQYLPMLKDIIAHEFMHILTPLNLRSEIIANFDYSRPNSEDQHLWLYEGVTEWVAHYMQLLSGDISAEEYLDRISGKINNSLSYGCTYSLTELSADWSTEEGGQHYGNIYQLGALTASALNLELLELSRGERGLRDVYIDLINEYGKERPFDNASFFDQIVQETYPEIAAFIDAHIRACNPIDYASVFSPLGISYIPEMIDEEAAPIMGLQLAQHGDKLVISGFSDPEMVTDLRIGDAILELFGEELHPGNYDAVMDRKKDMKAGDSYSIAVSRKGERIELTGTLIPKTRRHVFSVDDDATRKEIKLREAWLGQR